MSSLIRHLHDFARDVQLTPDEWLQAISFLTRTGQICTPERQEFILLSDVLGLSALVNLMHDKTATELGTESSLLGPFYHQNAPNFALGESIAVHSTGPGMIVQGQVINKQGQPLADALVQVWQTDAKGDYDLQIHGGDKLDMRGNFRTDADGRFVFRTLRPIGYSIPMDGPIGELVRQQSRHGCRPAHLHFLISAPGYRELVTALYLGDDQYIDSDTVFGVSSPLVVMPVPNAQGSETVEYNFCLGVAGPNGSGRVGADPAQIIVGH